MIIGRFQHGPPANISYTCHNSQLTLTTNVYFNRPALRLILGDTKIGKRSPTYEVGLNCCMYKLQTTALYGHVHCLLHLTRPRPTQSSLTSNIQSPYPINGSSPILQLLNGLLLLSLVSSILQNNVKSVDDTYKRSVNALLEQCFFGTHRQQATVAAISFAIVTAYLSLA